MVLDNVYSKFTNLEKDYRRTKKSRSQFITERFGGDIVVGSTIILDAIYEENPTTQEEIAKFSIVKDIISNILKAKDDLDYLESFDFSNDMSMATVIGKLLDSVDAGQTTTVPQRGLYEHAEALHFYVDSDGARYESPFPKCRFYRCENPNIYRILKSMIGTVANVEPDMLYEKQSDTNVKPVTEAKVKRVYNGKS